MEADFPLTGGGFKGSMRNTRTQQIPYGPPHVSVVRNSCCRGLRPTLAGWVTGRYLPDDTVHSVKFGLHIGRETAGAGEQIITDGN